MLLLNSFRSSGRHRSDRSFSNEALQQHQQQQQQQQQPLQTSFGGYSYGQMPPPPPQHHQQQSTVSIIYSFPQLGTDPYMIKYSGSPDGITLAVVKDRSPKRGNFQYFFKTTEDGITVKQLVTEDAEVVPTYNGKVMVEVTARPGEGNKTVMTANL